MANKYYYLISSLPQLTIGKGPAIKKEGFISECEKWLTPSDLKALAGISAQDKGLPGEWKEFDLDLREALAGARAARKGTPEKRTSRIAGDILGQENPLEMEKRFEGIRWSFLDEKEAFYHFDLNWLFIYSLKLEILERLDGFKQDKGEKQFQGLCEVKI